MALGLRRAARTVVGCVEILLGTDAISLHFVYLYFIVII